MTTKQRIKKQRIYATRINGEVVAYTRHHSQRAAQKPVLESKVLTEEASIDDLIRIGKDGVEVGGLVPDVDPGQQPLPL